MPTDFAAALDGARTLAPTWLGNDEYKAALAATPDRFPAGAPPLIRATRKAAEWAAGVHRAYDYLAARIREPERDKLDAFYEATMQGRPDFASVRANAAFAPVPVVAYRREVAAEIMRQAREIERETYAARAKGEHGGGLGRMALQLLEWFAFVMWPKARFGMFPSLAHIATASRMSRATVVKAMRRLETFGFLTVQARRKRVATPLGAKVVQDTSAYVLGLAKGLGELALAAFAKTVTPSEFTKPPANRNEHLSPSEAKPRSSRTGFWLSKKRSDGDPSWQSPHARSVQAGLTG